LVNLCSDYQQQEVFGTVFESKIFRQASEEINFFQGNKKIPKQDFSLVSIEKVCCVGKVWVKYSLINQKNVYKLP